MANKTKYNVEPYVTSSGVCPVDKFLNDLNEKDLKLYRKVLRSIELLKELGHDLEKPHCKYMGDGIYELRSKQSSNICRTFYFFYDGNLIILTNGFVKKTEQTPSQELKRAKRYRDDYFKRRAKDGLL